MSTPTTKTVHVFYCPSTTSYPGTLQVPCFDSDSIDPYTGIRRETDVFKAFRQALQDKLKEPRSQGERKSVETSTEHAKQWLTERTRPLVEQHLPEHVLEVHTYGSLDALTKDMFSIMLDTVSSVSIPEEAEPERQQLKAHLEAALEYLGRSG